MTDQNSTNTPEQGNDLPLSALFGAVYRLFYNKTFGLTIILAMAILTFLGVLFPQAPDNATKNQEMWKAWLETVRPKFAGFTDILGFLGVFRMFSSWPFIIVTALLALSILACTAHRAPNLWRQATAPRVHVGDGFFAKSRFHQEATRAGSLDSAMAGVEATLRKRRYRIIKDETDPTRFYADKNRWAPMGTVAAHVAFDIILIGVLVSSFAGFRDESVVVPEGGAVAVGHDTGITVRGQNLVSTTYDDGRPKDYAADLTAEKNGQVIASKTTRVNSPLRAHDVSFNLMNFGVGSDVEIIDAVSGKVIDHRVVPLDFETKDGVNIYGTYTIPDRHLEVYVVGVVSGASDGQIKPGQVLVEVYENGAKTPSGSAALDPGKPQKLSDTVSAKYNRETRYVALQVARDPGRIWVWIGSGLLIVGMCATMFLRHRRVWGKLETTADGVVITLASPDRADRAFEESLQAMASELSSTSTKKD